MKTNGSETRSKKQLTLPLREGQNREAVLGRGQNLAGLLRPGAAPLPKFDAPSAHQISTSPQGGGFPHPGSRPILPGLPSRTPPSLLAESHHPGHSSATRLRTRFKCDCAAPRGSVAHRFLTIAGVVGDLVPIGKER